MQQEKPWHLNAVRRLAIAYISSVVQGMCTVQQILSPTLEVWLAHSQASRCPDRHPDHLFILAQTQLHVLLGLPPHQSPSPLDSKRSQGQMPVKVATFLSMILSQGPAMLLLLSIRPLVPAGLHPSHLEIHLLENSMKARCRR